MEEATYLFLGIDGRAGFRWRKEYTITPIQLDNGEVGILMPKRPDLGPSTWTQQEFAEQWIKVEK